MTTPKSQPSEARELARFAEAEHRFFVRHTQALALAVAALVAGFVLTFMIHRDPVDPVVQGIDDTWLRWMVDHRSDPVVQVAKVFAFIGSSLVTWPLRFILAVVLAATRRWLQLTAFMLAIMFAEMLIGPLKVWVDRPRPPSSLVETSGASYPSGHAIAAAVTAFAVVVVFMPASRARLRVIGLAATFAALMALSRTYISAHWLTDVIGGVLLGVGVALGLPALLEIVREQWRLRRLAETRSPP